MSSLKYWLWLTSRPGMDSVSTIAVTNYFGSLERVYYAEERDYAPIGLRPALLKALSDKRMDIPERILESCDRLGIRILTIWDAEYPSRLKQIADPPAVLYVRGRVFAFDDEVAIGVVGARKPSAYGRKYAERFGMELAAGGALVVSGIAPGLDSCALIGALKGGGPVVSVLASGVDVVYPKESRFLYEDVRGAGALISEYPPGARPERSHFLRRNRIISGLSLGVLAVECRRHSGTMSTINHALDQDRQVYAVPGSLDAEMSEGTNWLIRQGATLVTCGRDILEEYVSQYPLKLLGRAGLDEDTIQARMEAAVERPVRNIKPEPPELSPAAKPEPPSQEQPKPTQAPKKSGRTFIPRKEQKRRFTDDALCVLAKLGSGMGTIDELVEWTQIPTKRVMSTLTLLHIEGVVEERPGKRFVSLVELEE